MYAYAGKTATAKEKNRRGKNRDEIVSVFCYITIVIYLVYKPPLEKEALLVMTRGV